MYLMTLNYLIQSPFGDSFPHGEGGDTPAVHAFELRLAGSRMTLAERGLAEAEAVAATVRVARLQVELASLTLIASLTLNIGLAQALRGVLFFKQSCQIPCFFANKSFLVKRNCLQPFSVNRLIHLVANVFVGSPQIARTAIASRIGEKSGRAMIASSPHDVVSAARGVNRLID